MLKKKVIKEYYNNSYENEYQELITNMGYKINDNYQIIDKINQTNKKYLLVIKEK